MDIKKLDQIAEKWGRVTPGRTRDYTLGVESPRKDWASATLQATSAYNQGMTDSIAERRWDRGVERAGTAKWKAKTLAKGPQRWSQGVTLAQPDYNRGFAPYHEALSLIQLPPRGPKGDPANIERVRVIAEALHELKRRIG